MKSGRYSRLLRRTAALLALTAALGGAAALAEDGAEEELYTENEWNFVDGSMDVSQGIPEDAPGVLGEIREAGVLRVATEPYFAPQEFVDETLSGQDRFVGSDMELARLIAERMGVELEIVPMEFSEVLPAVAEGDCDLAISGLSFTPERAESNTLSKGYHFAEDSAGCGVLIRAEDRDALRSLEDLADRNLAAQSGSLQESMAVDNIFDYREFRRLPSTPEVYEALLSGWADAIVVDVETAMEYMEAHPENHLMLMPGVQFQLKPEMEGDRIAGKKWELPLLYFVNGVIDEVLATGQYEDWFDEYEAYWERIQP